MREKQNKLIITRKDGQIISAYYEGERLVQANVEEASEKSLLGSIYLGKVKNIVKNIHAAFVEIADKKMCYLPLSMEGRPIFANPNPLGKIHVGDTIVVQVSKEDIKTKAPVATANISFTGKYAVLTHGKTQIGVSGKIKDQEERRRLLEIMEPLSNEAYGFIVRTNAIGVEKETLLQEIRGLEALYGNILQFGIHRTCFSRIYAAPAGYLCDIRNENAKNFTEIVTDDKELHESIQDYLNCYQKEDLEKLRFYGDSSFPLSRVYGLEGSLEKALQKKVWLKSGASLVIEPTEALTVIDVNTGKAIKGNQDMQATFLKINREAAEEIARQIRLRNLSGIILVDFIDLEKKEDQNALLKELEGHLEKDPIKTTLVDITPLGLAEITRKKVRKPLHEQVGRAGRKAPGK